jgi:thiol-disulfide isomerase/thioredoxin
MSAAPRWRRWLTLPNFFTALVLVWAAPRCWPHVAALTGVRDRARERVAQFAVQTRDGRTVTAESLRGHVVLINVWATWCPPCRAEMPALRQLADAYAADSVVVLGFSVDRGAAGAVDAFLRERHITYPVAIVSDAVIASLGGVQGYPTSFLLDKQGVIRHTVIGPVGPVTLRPAIRRLIDE